MIGQGLQHLLQSPMAGGQQQSLDPNDMVSQVMKQFEEWLSKRGTGAIPMGGRQGLQRPAQQSIQAPVGMSPRESAGQLREATGEGAATFMQQAGETAAQPWKPQALDIALIAASVAGPIIAALQPEGRGRRGQRKQQRMSGLFKGLGKAAQQGLGMRMGSFQEGKEAEYGVAETLADMSVKEAEAKYKRMMGGIEAAESKRRWEKGYGLAERDMAVKERPKPGKPDKPPYTPWQTRTIQLQEDKQRQENLLVEANQLIQSLKSGVDSSYSWDIKSIQDLDNAIYKLQKRFPKSDYSPAMMPGSGYGIVQQLKQLRDQYYGGGQAGKPADMTDAEWQEYLQMKDM